MTTVTQTIPNLVLGISQQPDELMLPGQVKDAKNVLLDVAAGLQKRPGSQLVGSAISSTYSGKWFAINRDANEQYIGRINQNGEVQIWSAIDGTPRVVKYQNIPYADPIAAKQKFIASLNSSNLANTPYASCNVANLQSDYNAYASALKDLNDLQAKIDAKVLAKQKLLESLGCKEVYSPYTATIYANNTQAKAYVEWNDGTTSSFNQPAAGTGQVVGVGAFKADVTKLVPTQTSVSNLVKSPTVKYSSVAGKAYAWTLCYTTTYKAQQTATIDAEIAALEAQLPSKKTLVTATKAAYEEELAACNLYVDPYSSVSNQGTVVVAKASPLAVDEDGVENITYTFTRVSSNLTNPYTVYYSLGGTATVNVDYVVSGDNSSATATDRNITIPANATTATLTINPTTDATVEGNESISVTIKTSNTYATAATLPVYSYILNDDSSFTNTILPYLKHSKPEDLNVLTINDYTFVSNKNSTDVQGPTPVSMSKSSIDKEVYEAFIQLTQIAYGKQYAINLNYSGTTQNATIVKSVATLDIVSSVLDTSATCPNIDSDQFDISPATTSALPDATKIILADGTVYTKSGGSWPAGLTRKNLRFELTTTGQAVPNNYSDATQGYKCVYKSEVDVLVGGEGWEVGDQIHVTMSGGKYIISVTDIKLTSTFASAGLVRPTATSTTSTTVIKADDILTDIQTAISSSSTGFTTTKIGNGIHLKHTKPFTIETPEAQLMNVFTNQVNNITRLPTQCKNGYVVKVINSADTEDDYYLKFVTKEGASGEGVWEETYKPGIDLKLNGSTMPHQIVRTPDGSFVVSPVDWEQRLVGDDDSNPVPSFVGKYIQFMTMYGNRLVMLSDENVVMSRPGDYFNFFSKTAIDVLPSDPIDISVGSTNPSVLTSAMPTKSGLLIFGDTEQFLIHTDNDVLSPTTVKLESVANYKYNTKTNPVTLGTSMAFLGDTGAYSSLYEIIDIPQSGEAKIIEQSKLVSTLLPDSIDQIVASRDYSTIFLGSTGSNEVWLFRYFDTGERRIQGAWSRWELTGKLVFHSMLTDGYYAVVRNVEPITGADVVTIQRFDLKKQNWSAFVSNDDQVSFPVHLDNSKIISSTDLTYDSTNDITTFKLPYGFFTDEQLVAYSLTGDNQVGLAEAVSINITTDSTTQVEATIPGDWTESSILVGYTFTMDVELPKFYIQTGTPTGGVKSDTRASLVIHRVKINFGDSGIYDTYLKRLGYEDYTETYAVPLYDQYSANSLVLKENYTQVVPVYAKNKDMTLHITSTHPSPATIHSVTWEGDYNSKFYRSV